MDNLKKSKNIKYCIAYGCLNTSVKRPDLSFFSLPRDPQKYREWLTRISRQDLLNKDNFKPKSYLVCSEHFDDSTLKLVKQLKPDSMPKPLCEEQMSDLVTMSSRGTQTSNMDIVKSETAEPPTPVACRICLSTTLSFEDIRNTPLQGFYEKLTDSVLVDGKKPHLLCRICHALMKTFHNFASNAVQSDQMLSEHLHDGVLLVPGNQADFTSLTLTRTPIETIDIDPNSTDIWDFIKQEPIRLSAEDIVPDVEQIVLVKPEEPMEYLDESGDFEETASPATDAPILSMVLEGGDKSSKNTPPPASPENKYAAIEHVRNQLIKMERKLKESFTIESSSDQSKSDSEDDVPLKNISDEQELRRKTVKDEVDVFGNEDEGVSSKKIKLDTISIKECTREIILTKEEQLAQFAERAKSKNYLNSPFKCEICFMGFIDSNAFENHRFRHDKTKKKSRQEILEAKRKASKERYKKIKSDPNLNEFYRKKYRENYLKSRKTKKYLNIHERSSQEQAELRERWRLYSSKYYSKKKKKEK